MQRRFHLIFLLVALTLIGCHMPTSPPAYTTPLPGLETLISNPPDTQPTEPLGDSPEIAPTELVIAPTERVPDEPGAIEITPAPTALAEPIQLIATVWEEDPQVPVLMYHRFDPRPGSYSYLYTTSLTDFDQQLRTLYDAGFSLVSLSDWLRGDIRVPVGRRPLIITIDDLFYADQIFLDENGNPAPFSGVGHLWAFSQAHPDFNFHAALFYNLGDKGYANYYANGVFSIGEGWREDRAKVIAWSIENDAMPMNHFYEHPFLNRLSPAQIEWQMSENDRVLRDALESIGREDLNVKLPNILALPYVVAPSTEAGKQVLYDYVNPEGVPVAAIIEGDYAGGIKYFPSPFSDAFNRWRVPRISASLNAIRGIVDQIDQFPVAASCELGAFWVTPHMLPEAVMAAILKQTDAGLCPYGHYLVNDWVFIAQENAIIQFFP